MCVCALLRVNVLPLTPSILMYVCDMFVLARLCAYRRALVDGLSMVDDNTIVAW